MSKPSDLHCCRNTSLWMQQMPSNWSPWALRLDLNLVCDKVREF